MNARITCRLAALLRAVGLSVCVSLWLVVAAGCSRETSEAKPAPVAANKTKASFAVTGMFCDGCAQHITEVVSGKPGVLSCDLTFASKQAVVEYDASQIGTDAIIAAVVEAGYKAKLIPETTGAPVAETGLEAAPATETAAPSAQ